MDDYQDRREAAVKRVKAPRDFKTHVAAYVIVNLFLIGIWALGDRGFFWPIWVMLAWGIGLAFNAWDVYFRKPISEEEIQQEMERGTD
jgi:hypothetical protein